MEQGPIGIFDSGYGGLTVLREIVKVLPDHDFLYLGDNARTPYGNRSFKTIYEYTLESVKYLLNEGCPLIILACNTASAKALRTIQQRDLPGLAPDRRVLGVIRPTAEVIGQYSQTGHVGVLGTSGTVNSESYLLEIKKQSPELKVFQQACPMWVPLVENGEHDSEGADYFVEKYLRELFSQSEKIDTLLLACTHYPLLIKKIMTRIPAGITVLNQGEIVAPSLEDYLNRHPEISDFCLKNHQLRFLTTDETENFNKKAKTFFGQSILSEFVHL
ncbi:glutamate racemase [Marinoscillum sp. 108]|uniref:glutamate racemase n=1 Tax=Marinoscillum sp. 108 TaxID=2653151 RepID=UPI0012F09F3F|nr:glutamate racemase [Marinoscillum sp. 108]VXD19900.1 Glutamate racemase [Marinoscillum sp. 108]